MVKPMRDYSAKEVAYYNHMFGVASVFIPSLETQVSLNMSWNPQRDETLRSFNTIGSLESFFCCDV